MNKEEFLARLRKGLRGLPQAEVEERVSFYSEMIDDRTEDGAEDAVASLGSVEDIIEQIIADIPLSKIAKEKIKPKRRLKWWEITLLIVGSPVWLPLILVVAAVGFAAYAVLWAMIVVLWASFGALAASAVGCVLAGIAFCASKPISGAALIGAGLASAGLAIAFFLGCKEVSKGAVLLTKKLVLWTKNRFVEKEDA